MAFVLQFWASTSISHSPSFPLLLAHKLPGLLHLSSSPMPCLCPHCSQDVKCSGNWMWAAKLPGEGAALADACEAMVAVMAALGVAVDGGKDSLSMAARVGTETVQAPGKDEALVRVREDLWAWATTSLGLISPCLVGSLVISAYAVCPDITATGPRPTGHTSHIISKVLSRGTLGCRLPPHLSPSWHGDIRPRSPSGQPLRSSHGQLKGLRLPWPNHCHL